MKNLILILFLFIGFNATAQVNLDSLNLVWLDETQEDKARFKAMKTQLLDDPLGYLYTNPDTAIILAKQLIALAEKKENLKWQAEAIYIQGLSRSRIGDDSIALIIVSKSLTLFEKINDKIGMANCKLAIGIIYENQEKIEEALDQYLQSEKLSKDLGYKLGLAKAYHNLAYLSEYQGNILESLKYFQHSLKNYGELGNKNKISYTLICLGNSSNYLGRLNDALGYYQRSLKIIEESGVDRNKASIFNNIGNIYFSQDNNAKALSYYQKSLKTYADGGFTEGKEGKHAESIAWVLRNIGDVFYLQGKTDEALENYQNSLELNNKIGYKVGSAKVLFDIGVFYAKERDTIQALEYLERSLKLSEKIKSKNSLSEILHNLGLIYNAQGDSEKALVFAKRSLLIGKELSSPWYIQYAANALKEIYKTQGKGLLALEMYELEIQMRDSLNREEISNGLIQMEVEHEYEKKELLAEQEHQQEIFKKNETRNYLIGGVSLALLFSIGILSRLSFVRKTNKELHIAKTRAEQSEQFKQQFLANMSHEIRTPMHAISGMVNILKRNEHPATQDTYLNAMHTSSDNLLVILNDVLDLSKIEVGKLDIESIPVKPADIVENVLQILKFKAEEKGLILSANIEKDVPSLVMGDPTRLNQILINLVGNSIKFTEKGSVKVLLTKVEDKLRFSITDTGIGIPKDRIEKIFGAFEQAEDSTSRSYGGTGLGLSITQQLTELQKGNIWVESEEGKGSTFFVELPIIAAAEDATGKELITEDNLKSRAAALSGTRILLVEDNAFNQMIAQDDLNYYIENVKIDTVENGLLAVEKYQANDYDLILMDVQMPLMNGFEATQKIRDLEKAAGKENTMPIIAMTASLLKSEVDSCYRAGMNNYIPKPYQPEQLIGPIYEELK